MSDMGPENWEKHRHIENDEYFDDQDGGQNGHFIRVSIKKEETSEGIKTTFTEEHTQNQHDRAIIPDKIISTIKHKR